LATWPIERPQDWIERVNRIDDESELESLRQRVHKMRPFGRPVCGKSRSRKELLYRFWPWPRLLEAMTPPNLRIPDPSRFSPPALFAPHDSQARQRGQFGALGKASTAA
jgi:hypothetical protein